MPVYRSNDDESIKVLFENDGEYLRQHGFSLPTELKTLADDARPRPDAPQGMSAIAIEAAQKWEETGSDELF